MTSSRLEHLAMAAVAMSGLAWGLFWIPLRALDQAGVSGLWAVVLFYTLPTVLLTPLYVWRRDQIAHGGWPLHLAGVLAGTSLVFYAGALVFTDVVRALLFYYMTPIWSTVLARIVIGETITGARWVTIGLGLLGLTVILKLDTGLGGPLNFGDWLGLASGLVWAMAAVAMNANPRSEGLEFALSYFFWGSLAALGLTLLPLGGTGEMPDWDTLVDVLPWITPLVLVLVIPPAIAIMWGATILSPGLLSILFMTEISAGTVTAAIWADEPFGAREVLGVLLITIAGAWEPVRQTLHRRR
ncbi:MAG: DMT family transporter [Pseudomonadota bacterium]